MFPPLPHEKASLILDKVINALHDGRLSLEQTARPSEGRKNQGVMLGVLVCTSDDGNTVNLAAVSGNAKTLALKEGSDLNDEEEIIIVPSVVSADRIEEALSENDREIHELTDRIKGIKDGSQDNFNELRARRDELCTKSLEKVHALYGFHCIDGRLRSLKEICAAYNQGKLPPTGTGDCCAPKLFDYAFSHGLKPVSLAEVPYAQQCSGSDWQIPAAKPCRAEEQIKSVPPCDERCGIVLPAMLGLRIIYRDEYIIVVNKQSGLLSVPGRGEDKQDCIVNRVRRLFPDCIEQPAVHRLDMETSGLMVLAFTKECHRDLNRQFEEKRVHKQYTALLDGVLAAKGIEAHGQMELFFRLDVDNRPHQIWDRENGKSAVTEWQILNVERYSHAGEKARNVTRVLFTPHTGRTHQLRLASADSHGFGVPIIGDTLYGKCLPGERLMLHASMLEFTHPESGEIMHFECPPEF